MVSHGGKMQPWRARGQPTKTKTKSVNDGEDGGTGSSRKLAAPKILRAAHLEAAPLGQREA